MANSKSDQCVKETGAVQGSVAAPVNLDANAVRLVPGSIATGIILLCDHASNALPKGYATLGLPPAELDRHIAYDIGAAGVTTALASRLNAPALLTRQSRLLIDANRGLDDPTLIMRVSDGAIIPGNRTLDHAERVDRIQRYYVPYHCAISALIDQHLAEGVCPVILSIHSFTPVWKGRGRPWHGAVLWDRDPRIALPLLEGLRADQGRTIGDNEPYSGILKGDTLWQHGTRRGLPHAIVEIRQDLIEAHSDQQAWADRLADVMQRVRVDPAIWPGLSRVSHYGSHTDPL